MINHQSSIDFHFSPFHNVSPISLISISFSVISTTPHLTLMRIIIRAGAFSENFFYHLHNKHVLAKVPVPGWQDGDGGMGEQGDLLECQLVNQLVLCALHLPLPSVSDIASLKDTLNKSVLIHKLTPAQQREAVQTQHSCHAPWSLEEARNTRCDLCVSPLHGWCVGVSHRVEDARGVHVAAVRRAVDDAMKTM